MQEHIKDEFFFSEAVMLTTQNNSFGPTEISYLENKFTNMAIDTDRYKVRNSNDPNPGNVTEEKESELEDFIEYSKMVLGVLGYKIFVPLIDKDSDDKKKTDEVEELTLYLSRKSKKSNKTIEAMCKRTDEGFVVLKGSMIETINSKAIPKSIKVLREKCIENNEIVDGRITKNYLFNSPSYAASFVLGTNANGRTEWKTKDHTTLKELDGEEILMK